MSNINYEADRLSEASLNGGTLYVTALDVNDKPIGGYRSLGYCVGIQMTAEDEKAELKSSLQGPRTTAEEVLLERTLGCSVTLQDVQPENIELALHGTVESAAAETGKVEVLEGFLGKPTPLQASINFEGTAPALTNEAGDVVYEEGLNYELNQGSAYWLVDQSGATTPFVDGDKFEITYDSNKSKTVQGYTKSSVKVGFYFEGFNQAKDNAAYQAWMHKVSLSPTTDYSILSTDDFVTLTLEGTMLSSKAVQGSGLSKFFKQTSQDLS